jgi:hypothetical protein
MSNCDDQTEASAIQGNYSPAPERTYYKFTQEDIEASSEYWTNPLFTLFPQIGHAYMKNQD